MIVKTCQNKTCKREWACEESDPFITCPLCRIPAPLKKKRRRSYMPRSATASPRDQSPSFDNVVRSYEES